MAFFILGISFGYHDSSACLIKDENILSAVQEERFSRAKNDRSFPINSIKYILSANNLSLLDVDAIAYYEDPGLKLQRQFNSLLCAKPTHLLSRLYHVCNSVLKTDYDPTSLAYTFSSYQLISYKYIPLLSQKIYFSKHHLSHAFSAFYPSPYADAAIICIDGVGENITTSIWHGTNRGVNPLLKINYPDSLGLLYSAFTYYCGFKVNSGEYKLMGLAPYGRPIYTDLIKKNLVYILDNGSFKLNPFYFEFIKGEKIISNNFAQLFHRPIRLAEEEIEQFHMDIAASIQYVTEEIVLRLAYHARELTKSENLCLSGGVALNCVANGKIRSEKIFENVWVQPASGDAGSSLGAAYAVLHNIFHYKRTTRYPSMTDNMINIYLGPHYSDHQIEEVLESSGAVYERLSPSNKYYRISSLLATGNVVGWFQGRLEFGPRALGNRSILGDPRNPNMQKIINLKIKFRESFRPFAPAILEEYVDTYFLDNHPNPYMLFVSKIKKNLCENLDDYDCPARTTDAIQHSSPVPAITHVDYSARIQTVTKKSNPEFYDLISKFYELTGCPMLINTSFNVRGEPIVCTPDDAYNCFINTNMDVLVLGNYLVIKSDQCTISPRVVKPQYFPPD